MIIGPPDTLYEGGFFKTRLSFPKDYPQVNHNIACLMLIDASDNEV
jgi:ubiquitin-protein ligase